MKTRRAALGTLAGLCLFMGLVTGERLYYAVFFAALMAALLSLGVAFWARVALRFHQNIKEDSLQKGGVVTLRFTVENNMPLPLSRVDIHYDTQQSVIDGRQETRRIWLRGMGAQEISAQFVADYWGRYEVGIAALDVYDPLGLFCLRLDARKLSHYKPLGILIYPRSLTPAHMNLPSSQSDVQDVQKGRLVEHSAQLDHMRRYVHGDSLRRIHWKLSARMRQLLIKVYEDSAFPRLLLAVDCHEHGLEGLDAIRVEDTLVECTAAIANYTLLHGLPTRLLAYPKGAVRLLGDNPLHLRAFQDSIARLSFHGDYTMRDILRIEPYDDAMGIVVLTHNISSELFERLVEQQLSGVRTLVLCVTLTGDDPAQARAVAELHNKGVRARQIRAGDDVIEAVSSL